MIPASSSPAITPEALHPAIWRASQLGRGTTRCTDTGHPALSMQLPGGGWPIGTLTELLLQRPGIGELRLLGPALASVERRGVMLVTPPNVPHILALTALGVRPDNVTWIRCERSGDALWAAEQVLRSGTCGALLLWQPHVQQDRLRRLHLAAQQGETLFVMFRHLNAAVEASPAPLRLGLRPAVGGLEIQFIKRQGPSREERLFLPMPLTPVFRPMPRGTPAEMPVQRAATRQAPAPDLVR